MSKRYRGYGWMPIVLGRLFGQLAPKETKSYDMKTEDAIPWRQVLRGVLAVDSICIIVLYFIRWLPLWEAGGNLAMRQIAGMLITIGLGFAGALIVSLDYHLPRRIALLMGVLTASALVSLWLFLLHRRFYGWYDTHSLYSLQGWRDLAMQTLIWNVPPGFFIFLPPLIYRNFMEVHNPWWQQYRLIQAMPKLFQEVMDGMPAESEGELPPIAVAEDLVGEEE